MTTSTTLRSLIDRELTNRGTTFEEFIGEHDSINQAAAELRRLTSIPVSRRTIYRWARDLKVSA